MKIKLALSSIMMFFLHYSYSQETHYRIITKDKQEYQGVTNKFKISYSAKKIKIPTAEGDLILLSEELTDIYLSQGDQVQVHLVHLPSKWAFTKKIIKEKKAKWIAKIETTPKIEMYQAGQRYTMKSGYLEIKSTGQKHFVGLLFFYKKPTDNFLMHIGDNSGAINSGIYLRLIAPSYFSDCPSLVEKIEKKEFKFNDIKSIMDYYSNQCK